MPLLDLPPQARKAANVLFARRCSSHRRGRTCARRVRDEHVARAVIVFVTWREQIRALVAVVEYRVSRNLPTVIDEICAFQVQP